MVSNSLIEMWHSFLAKLQQKDNKAPCMAQTNVLAGLCTLPSKQCLKRRCLGEWRLRVGGLSGPLFNTTTALDLMIIRFNHDYHAKPYTLWYKTIVADSCLTGSCFLLYSQDFLIFWLLQHLGTCRFSCTQKHWKICVSLEVCEYLNFPSNVFSSFTN